MTEATTVGDSLESLQEFIHAGFDNLITRNWLELIRRRRMELEELITYIFGILAVLLSLFFWSLALKGSGAKGKAFMAVTTFMSISMFIGETSLLGFVAFYSLFIYVIGVGIMGEFLGMNK